MDSVKSEQTTQTIGKTRFIVVSKFKADGLSVEDKISRLLQREAKTKHEIDLRQKPLNSV